MPDDAMLALVAIIAVLMWEATRRLIGPMFVALLTDAERRLKQREELLAVERVLYECNYNASMPLWQQARTLRLVAAEVGYPSERVLDKVAGDFGLERKEAAPEAFDLTGSVVAVRGILRDGSPAYVRYTFPGSVDEEEAKEISDAEGQPVLLASTGKGEYATSEDMRVEFERVVSTEVRDGCLHPTETKWEVVHD